MNAKAHATKVAEPATDAPIAGTAPTGNTPTIQPTAAEAAAANGTGTDLAIVDFGDDEGAGLKNIKADELTISFIRSVHYSAPQVKPPEPKFIKGATPGMLLKTSTNEVFPGLETGLDFLPVYRDHNYVEYTPRDAGGGFVGIRPTDDPLIAQLKKTQSRFGKLKTTTNTELTETFNIYGLFITPTGRAFPAVLGFSSTQIKKYQAFMETQTALKEVYPNPPGSARPFKEPPMWAHRWNLITRPESNKKGDYFGYVMTMVNGATIENPRPALVKPNDHLYQRAKELYQAIEAGRATVDHEGDVEAGGGNKLDDDIPF